MIFFRIFPNELYHLSVAYRIILIKLQATTPPPTPLHFSHQTSPHHGQTSLFSHSPSRTLPACFPSTSSSSPSPASAPTRRYTHRLGLCGSRRSTWSTSRGTITTTRKFARAAGSYKSSTLLPTLSAASSAPSGGIGVPGAGFAKDPRMRGPKLPKCAVTSLAKLNPSPPLPVVSRIWDRRNLFHLSLPSSPPLPAPSPSLFSLLP
ncbi:hypothetical protein ACRALDRAFT_1059818 [Sodiomyces alcalophilus JCM 7366]|uniref:uncharacterized protein n=1 Tax=Sodiomyces alcalophilus JCM 7366 TaxID=591952 RepID=UPI0039B3C521